MRTVSGPEFGRILERHGWELRRVKSSHHIYAKAGNPNRISVPVHGNQLLKTGLQRHQMCLADLTDDDLA